MFLKANLVLSIKIKIYITCDLKIPFLMIQPKETLADMHKMYITRKRIGVS